MFLGVVRIGEIDGELVVNPTWSQLSVSYLDLVIACSKTKVGKQPQCRVFIVLNQCYRICRMMPFRASQSVKNDVLLKSIKYTCCNGTLHTIYLLSANGIYRLHFSKKK